MMLMKTLIMSIEEKGPDGQYIVERIKIPISGQYKDLASFLETTYKKLLKNIEESKWCEKLDNY